MGADLNETINELLDNWEKRNCLEEQTSRAEAERDKLIGVAFRQGADATRIALATGLSRQTLWRIRKRLESDPAADEPGWDVTGPDDTVRGVPAAMLEQTIRDLSWEAFDRACGFDQDDPANDDRPTALDFNDTSLLTDEQRALRDRIGRLALRAQTSGDTELRDDELGITLKKRPA